MAFNKRFKDLTGQKFGRLTVLRLNGKDKRSHNIWLCQCVCGNTALVNTYDLEHGKTRSCGCLADDLTIMRNTTHNKTHHPLYRVYNHMKDRCYRETDDSYKNYGARGIKICDEWLNDFMAFYNWSITHGYKNGLTIDRINNNGNYTPENCRWVGMVVQCNNKRTNIYITYKGVTQTLGQWVKDFGLNYQTCYKRYRKGLPLNEVFKRLD